MTYAIEYWGIHMTTVSHSHTSAAKYSPVSWKAALPLLQLPIVWMHRLKSRRALLLLEGQTDHMLKDVGLQRSDIQRETIKWFWTA